MRIRTRRTGAAATRTRTRTEQRARKRESVHRRLTRASARRRMRRFEDVRREEQHLNRLKVGFYDPRFGRRFGRGNGASKYAYRSRRIHRERLREARRAAALRIARMIKAWAEERSARGRVSLVKKFENGIPELMRARSIDDRYDIGRMWLPFHQLTDNQRIRYFGLGINDLEYLAWHFGEGAIHFPSHTTA